MAYFEWEPLKREGGREEHFQALTAARVVSKYVRGGLPTPT